MKKNQYMKSAFSLLLAAVMVLMLVACGGGTSSSSPEQAQGSLNPDASGSSENPGDPSSSGTGSSSNASSDDKTPLADTLKTMLQNTISTYEKNSDTIGWLKVDGTDIDEAVVQASNNDYYLRRTYLKQNSFNGCYYADFRTYFGSLSEMSKNVVIYGHSMDDDPNGDRFSQLKRYMDIEYCRENPYIYFITPDSSQMVWQIFAVFTTEVSFNYINPNPSNAEFLNIVTEARKRSDLNFDVDVGVNDHILTLSTCIYTRPENRSNYRYVVMAKLLSDTSNLPETVKVEVNPSPKAPA